MTAIMQEVPEVLPCGCKIAKRIIAGERQFVMEPCSPDCEYFKFCIEKAQRQGKQVRKEPGTFSSDGRVK